MKESLKPGIKYQHRFKLTPSKMVPALYPEAEEFLAMPEVFATGFLVGFLEWACIRAINPHLNWPREQSVGTHVDVSHVAATPPGLEVTATVELIAIEGRKLVFAVEAHDGVDLISKGRHERYIINKEKFEARVAAKASPMAAQYHLGRLIDHVHLRVEDLDASKRFYRAALTALRKARADGPVSRVHLAFQANSEEQVQAFHREAIAAGGRDNGAPGERKYHPGYYGAFVLDPDGNNIEAVFHGPALRSAPSVVVMC